MLALLGIDCSALLNSGGHFDYQFRGVEFDSFFSN